MKMYLFYNLDFIICTAQHTQDITQLQGTTDLVVKNNIALHLDTRPGQTARLAVVE